MFDFILKTPAFISHYFYFSSTPSFPDKRSFTYAKKKYPACLYAYSIRSDAESGFRSEGSKLLVFWQ
jgi:hypothetical protein